MSERGKVMAYDPTLDEAMNTEQLRAIIDDLRQQLADLTVRRKRRGSPRRGPADIDPSEFRCPAYLMFVREEGRCVVCNKQPGGMPYTALLCDPAHTENGGMRQKGRDSSCVPLCRRHHDELDGRVRLPNAPLTLPLHFNFNRREQFEMFYGVSLAREAAVWWAAFKMLEGN